MASRQIPDVPDPMDGLQQLEARHNRRSLTQQVIPDLQRVCGEEPRERRRQALAELEALAIMPESHLFDPSPEELIRQDRAR